jgi:hypothetical protein
MIHLVALYALVIASIVFPPFLLVTIPLAVVYTAKLVKRKRQIDEVAIAAMRQKNHDAMVRYFR